MSNKYKPQAKNDNNHKERKQGIKDVKVNVSRIKNLFNKNAFLLDLNSIQVNVVMNFEVC